MRCKCKKCGKFIKEKEAFHEGKDLYCGDCALQILVKVHGFSEHDAYHKLERIQFGNGIGW